MSPKNKHTILSILVKDALPTGTLGLICRTTLDSFFDESRLSQHGWVIVDSGKDGGHWRERYAYKDNGASILAVAHCDTVWDGVYPYRFHPKELKVFSPELDDRLGVYVVTSLLPRLGVNCDVLLTENEEFCSSTAIDFTTEKKYNWIMEWDRRGAGVVLYQYETTELKHILKKYDFHIELGTYSDICDLYSLGVAGMNFATGYANEHTKSCFADLRCLAKQVVKFLRFYNDYKDVRIESKAGSRYASRYYSRYYSYRDYDDDDYWGGYYDKDGNWHFYGASSAAGTGIATNYKYRNLDYQKCTCCGETSKVRTAYTVRGNYICPTCEHICPSCRNRYSFNQIDATTGFCYRCRAVLDALNTPESDFHECGLCKRKRGCVEVWDKSWVCDECLTLYFTICDDCLGLMPAKTHGTKLLPAVGICTLCQESIDTKKIISTTLTKVCDGCGETFPQGNTIRFVKEGLNLCNSCASVKLEGYEDDDFVVDRDGNSIVDDTVVAYDNCDICEVRDQLFEVEGMHICNNCRTRVLGKGV